MIKQATQAAGGKITTYVSPWSPPAFMKSNKQMLKGGTLLPKYYQAWAKYYAKFIKAYEKEGMPIWGKLRMMSDLFTSNNSAVVASTYCSSWVFDKFDEEDPWNSTARAYTEIFINRSEKAKMKMLTEWFKEFKIDGIVYHDSKTCFNNSNAKFGMPQRLKEQTGIPALIIEGDLCDLRFFSEGQSITKVETFIEQIQDSKILN